jgi:hypothetical protein
MIIDPLVAAVEVQPAVHTTEAGATQPVPSAEQEQMADNVFSPEVQRTIAAVLGVQTGLAVLGHIIAETAPSSKWEHLPRRKDAGEPASEA